jgi:hypothetical protein
VIIEGGSYSAGWWWAGHVKNTEKNERWQVMEVEGLSGQTIEEYFKQMHAASKGTNCKNYFEQWNINLCKGEKLTDEQWQECHAVARKNHGLAGQPFFRIRHTKREPDGSLQEHEHCFTLNIDIEKMRAIPHPLSARTREQTSRELERKFGLTPVQSVLVPNRDGPRPERRAKKYERFRGAQTGIDPHGIDREARAIKERSDNGQSFKAGLEAAGYVLAIGRRGFVIADQAGDIHNLPRRLGMKVEDVRAFMADVDPKTLPTAAQATRIQRGREAAQEGRRRQKGGIDTVEPRPSHMRTGGPENGRERPSAPVQDQPGNSASKRQTTVSEMRGAWEQARDAGDLIAGLSAKKITLARVSADDAKANEQARKVASALGRFEPRLKEGEIVAVNQRGRVYRFDKRTTGLPAKAVKERMAGVDAGFLLSVEATKAAIKAASREAWIKTKQTERDKARPASWIEQKIIDCDRQARLVGVAAERNGEAVHLRGNEAFAEGLHQAGITIVRVTGFDASVVLDALRQDEDRAREIARSNGVARKSRTYARVKEGELAAVTRQGDVYRLNPQKLHLAGIERRLVDARPPAISSTVPPSLPSVEDARAAFRFERQHKEALWAQRRADNEARRALRSESREVARQRHVAANTIRRGARQTIAEGKAIARAGVGIVGKVARLAKSLSPQGLISGLGNIMASPSKPTELERTVAPKVAKENQERAADLAAYFDNKDRLDDLLRGISRDDAERMRQRRERGDNDPVDRGRERDR